MGSGVSESRFEGVNHPAAGHLSGLDGLRGVAVLLVVAHHLWPGVVQGGFFGVGLFFTLSGYLIIGLLDAELVRSGGLRWGVFLGKRVRRLLPAALVTVAVTVVGSVFVLSESLVVVGRQGVASVLNVQNWYINRVQGGLIEGVGGLVGHSPLNHFWSLSIEEQFYLTVPLLLLLTRRPVWVVVGMVGVGVAGVVVFEGSDKMLWATSVRSLEISAGALLVLASVRVGWVRRWVGWGSGGVVRFGWWVVTGLCVVVAVLAVEGSRLGEAKVSGGVQALGLVWVVLLVAALPGGPLGGVLSVSWLRWLGARSYAIYLYHVPLIVLVSGNPVFVVVATGVLAELSYRFLECPVRRSRSVRCLVWLGVCWVGVLLLATFFGFVYPVVF